MNEMTFPTVFKPALRARNIQQARPWYFIKAITGGTYNRSLDYRYFLIFRKLKFEARMYFLAMFTTFLLFSDEGLEER